MYDSSEIDLRPLIKSIGKWNKQLLPFASLLPFQHPEYFIRRATLTTKTKRHLEPLSWRVVVVVACLLLLFCCCLFVFGFVVACLFLCVLCGFVFGWVNFPMKLSDFPVRISYDSKPLLRNSTEIAKKSRKSTTGKFFRKPIIWGSLKSENMRIFSLFPVSY